jgi:hypothetical protein
MLVKTTEFDRALSQTIAILDLQDRQLIEDLSASEAMAISGGTVTVKPKRPISLGGIGVATKIPLQVIQSYRCPDGTIVTYCSDGSSDTPPPGLCHGSQAI